MRFQYKHSNNMILIIYPLSDKSSQEFIFYLEQEKVDHLALEINKDILNSGIQIIDRGKECLWTIHKKEINFKNISGIYNRVHYLDYINFMDYKEEDIDYVQREWWAYLFYRMEMATNCINPPSCELISGAIIDFTYFYSIAKSIGFKVPEYFVSTSYCELKEKFNDGKKYIALSTLFLNNNFTPSEEISNNTIALIEYIKGDIILSHIIEEKIYSCFIKGKEKIDTELNKNISQLCYNLKKVLKVRIMQIIFVQKDNEVFLLNISAFPNWNHNSISNKQKIYQDLVGILQRVYQQHSC